MPMQPMPTGTGSVTWVGPEDPAYAASGLIHNVRLPEAAGPSRPAPAVVMVHGWGGDESVMWIFKQAAPAGVALITPRAPLDLGEEGYAWFRHNGPKTRPEPASLTAGIAHLHRFLTSLPELYPIDPARLVLIGFSQGAMVSNGLVLTHPNRVIGMASLAGSFPEVPEAMPEADLLAGFPVFIAHGTRDEIVPLSAARQTREAYTWLGAEITYGEYAVGHKMNVQAIKDLKAWLAKVIIGPSPH